VPEAVQRVPLLFGPDGRPAPTSPAWGKPRPSDPAWDGRTPAVNPPLTPAYGQPADARQFFPFVGYNVTYVPRSEYLGITPFGVLRALGDTDVVRVVIEDVKASLAGFSWEIHTDEHEGGSKTSEISSVKAFMERPAPNHTFDSFLMKLLEEVLVIDALSLYRWRTRAGEPFGLVVLDGTTIKPLVDVLGMVPGPPLPGYQQIILGRPETEYTMPWGTSDSTGDGGQSKVELVYAPRHPRAHMAYGQSPVERVLVTLNLILRRQMHYLAWYTDGTIPDMFWKVPEEWSAEQMKQAQAHLDELLSGDSAARRRVRLMPGGGADYPKGHEEWKYDFDEFLVRIVAWAFGVSPLPIAKMMNRSTSEQADAAETDSGIKPLQKWVEGIIDREIQEFLGFRGLHFKFTDEKAADEELESRIAVEKVKAGIWTIDDALEREGKPKTNIPRFVMTPSGPMLLSAESLADGGILAIGGGTPPPGLHPALAAAPSLLTAGGGVHPALAAVPPLPATKAEAEDLRKWRKVALKALRAGKPQRPFESTAIPAGRLRAIAEWLQSARTQEDVDWGFRALVKARRPLVAARRRIRLERNLRTVVSEHFRTRAPGVASLILPRFRAAAQKAEDTLDGELDRAFEWRVLAENLEKPLASAYLEGEVLAADAASLEVAFGLTDAAATEYARARGAELIGMKLSETGELIPNPSAKWSVPQSVREQIRSTVARALEEGWTEKQLQQAIEGGSIWDWRSDMIARTEAAFALNRGAVDTYKGAGIERVRVLDGPGCLEDGHDDSEPGVNGEVWDLEKSMEFPLGHPNCRRDFTPEEEGAA